MHKFLLLSILKLCLLASLVLSNPNCASSKSCDECISTVGCAWCKELGFQKPRCDSESQLKYTCARDIVTVSSSEPRVTVNEQISKSVRIQPQEVTVDLAVGQITKNPIKLTYNDSTDKQLDLYYIMDLSATMEDDKTTVSEQAANLVRALSEITKDVRLGFGSFIDKPVLPFVSSSQLRENSQQYDKPYGFKNWLPLTSQTQDFSNVVRNAKISRNLDEPEGTLDALMQSVVCTNEIGWRNSSRKLIVVATDGPFHIAGDGKLGGIVRPNDMKCHLDKDGLYTHSTLLDYPSIGEMNAVILDHKVYVIFAVSAQGTDDVYNVYKELANHITESTAKLLKKDSGNVVETIKQKYAEISETVRLRILEKPENVDVLVKARCSDNGNFRDASECTSVNQGQRIEFEIRLKLTKCPDPRRPTPPNKVVISFFELTAKEKLVINLNYQCTCPCSQQFITREVDLVNHCNGKNASTHISCGLCGCREDRYGTFCQCSKTDENENTDNTKCTAPSAQGNQNITCSNKGQCKCGQCECDRDKEQGLYLYNGPLCEHSTGNCRNPNKPGTLCSGKGNCEEGKCQGCEDGYDGKYCECETEKKHQCKEPGKSQECNGQGVCDCDYNYRCKCNPGYDGFYCGICKSNCKSSNQLGSRCQDKFLQKCVKCKIELDQMSGSNQQEEKCKDVCDFKKRDKTKMSGKNREDISAISLVRIPNRAGLSDVIGTECRLQLNSTPCFSDYKYDYDSRGNILQVYFTSDGITCVPETPIIWIVIGVILSVLVAGILGLLIWKVATHLHDTREYQKFEKEIGGAKFQGGENPLYENPNREFQNPAYRD